MAVGSQNIDQFEQTDEVDVVGSRARVLGPRCSAIPAPLSFGSNGIGNSSRPPVLSDLDQEHGVDDDANRVFEGIQFPVQFPSDVLSAAVNSAGLKRVIPKVSDNRHGLFDLFLFLPCGVQVLCNYGLRGLQQIGDFNISETSQAELKCFVRLRCSFHALNHQCGKQRFDAVSRYRLVVSRSQ